MTAKTNSVPGRFLWSNDCKTTFQTAITESESVNKIVALDEMLNTQNTTDINSLNDKLTNIYISAAFKTRVYKNAGKHKKIKKHKPKP